MSSNPKKRKLCRLWRKMVTRGLQHSVRTKGLTKGLLMLLHQKVWVQTLKNVNYVDYGEKWLQEVFSIV